MIDYSDYIYKTYPPKKQRHKQYRAFCDVCQKDKGYVSLRLGRKLCQPCAAKRMGKNKAGRVMSLEARRKMVLSRYGYELPKLDSKKIGNKIYYIDHCPDCGKELLRAGTLHLGKKCKSCVRKNPNCTPAKMRLKRRMAASIRCRLRRRHLEGKGGRSTFDILGYTVDELYKHIESRFQQGMTWDNMGEWHIDHIIPDSQFKYFNVDDEEFKKSWDINNLQPLWAKDNISKGSKLSSFQ